MKLLLDTHLLLWAAQDRTRLPKTAARLMSDRANELLFSVISLWEIEIKRGLRRCDLEVDLRDFRRGLVTAGYIELSLTSDHVLRISSLPRLHGDPFDRVLVAQALAEEAILLTADAVLAKYGGAVRRV